MPSVFDDYDYAEPVESVPGRVDRIDNSGDLPWHPAPSSSHVHSFRLYDADDPQLRRFIRRFLGGQSQLQVRFKPSGSRGITEYTYFFASASEAREIFAEMQSAEHPGKVIHARLVKPGVSFRAT